MRPHLLISGLMLAVGTMAAAQTFRGFKVLPRPADRWTQSQKEFAAWELPFQLPRRLKANALYESLPFYAVVLKRERTPSCDGGEFTKSLERFRREAQARFPDRKVFADHQCPDMGSVSYRIEGQDQAMAFVAVYAGSTRAEGEKVRRNALARYPGARLVRLRVGYSRIVQ